MVFIIGGIIVLAILVLILLIRYAVLGLIGTVLLGSFSMSSFLISNAFINQGGITDTNQYTFIGIFAFIFMLGFVFSRMFLFFEGVRKEYLLTRDFRKSIENALKLNIWRTLDLHVILFIFSVVLFLTTYTTAPPIREFSAVLFAGVISSFGVLFILLPFIVLPLAVNQTMAKIAKYWNFDFKKLFKKHTTEKLEKVKKSKNSKTNFAIKIKNLWFVFLVPAAAIIALIVSFTAGVNTQSDFQPGAQFVIYDNDQSSIFVNQPTDRNSAGFIEADGRVVVGIVDDILTNNTIYRVTNVEVGTFFLSDTLANQNDLLGLRRNALIFTTNVPDISSRDGSIEELLRASIIANAAFFSDPSSDLIVNTATVILPGIGSSVSLELVRAFGIFFGFLALYVIVRYRKSQLLVITLSLIASFGLIISLLIIFQIPLVLLVVVGFMMAALFLLVTQFTLFNSFNEKVKHVKNKDEAITKQKIIQMVNETYKENLWWMILFSFFLIIIMIAILIPLASVVASVAAPVIIAIFVATLLPLIWSLPLLISFESYWLFKTKQMNSNVEKKKRKVDEHSFKGINAK